MNDISVAVISYNTRELLRRCVTSVFTDEGSDVVVADNGSTDGTVAMPDADFVRRRCSSIDRCVRGGAITGVRSIDEHLRAHDPRATFPVRPSTLSWPTTGRRTALWKCCARTSVRRRCSSIDRPRLWRRLERSDRSMSVGVRAPAEQRHRALPGCLPPLRPSLVRTRVSRSSPLGFATPMALCSGRFTSSRHRSSRCWTTRGSGL